MSYASPAKLIQFYFQVWHMVNMSRSYLQRGHLSMIWQDDAFYYSYFLWFEDSHGTQLKPKEIPNSTSANAIKPHVVPGVIAGEFYQYVGFIRIIKRKNLYLTTKKQFQMAGRNMFPEK